MSDIREKTINGLKTGDSFTISRTFTEKDMLAFADITRDYNPVHFDERFARTKNFSGRICHGLMTAGMVTQVGGQIGWLATGMHFEFKKPVYFGDTITCNFTISDIDKRGRARADVICTNQAGHTVFEAWITGMLPASPEVEVLAAMVSEGDPTNGLKCEK
ncbi:MAG: MaoC family dehydratase [Deltaproteobacteria bacterium]|nr:MaoC family dehydratase [Deltaproteobacteria bacterium]MBW2634328.1 MaoC family dehydratase [Deltaproteobacteria bacterium]MBW2676154.1 MaoC family dehydratase [Deltaproteobacteria bacterium]